MRSFVAKFGLPLLARELVQLSSHRRTYVLRFLYATFLYVAALQYYRRWANQFPADSFEILGQGKTLFDRLVDWQFLGVYLFLPLMTAGAITAEKERQTLIMLKLTRLGSWTILLQKLCSRLIEIGVFLLLSLPLEAMAYGFGGVELEDVGKAAFVLSLTAISIGCFSLFCSSWFHSTASATVAAYLLGALVMSQGTELIEMAVTSLRNQTASASISSFVPGWTVGFSTMPLDLFRGEWVLRGHKAEPITSLLMGDQNVTLLDFALTVSIPGGPRGPTPGVGILASSWSGIGIRSLPMIIFSMLFLTAARYFLWKRAESHPLPWGRSLYRWVDRLFGISARRPLDQVSSSARRPVFVRSCPTGDDLPGLQPIAWYSRRRLLVGNTRYLVRNVLMLQAGLILFVTWRLVTLPNDWPIWLEFAMMSQMAWIGLWLLSVLLIIAIASGRIPAERNRQTLDVLAACPLTSRELVLQQSAGLRRWIVLLWFPFLTIVAMQAGSLLGLFSFSRLDTRVINREVPAEFLMDRMGLVMFVIRRLLALLLYLPLIGWIGFQCGLRFKNQFRAILATLFFLLAFWFGPDLIRDVIYSSTSLSRTAAARLVLAFLEWLNLRTMAFEFDRIGVSELGRYVTSDLLPTDWFPVLFHFLIVGGMLWGVRRNALRNFSRLIGRLEPGALRHVQSDQTPSPILFSGQSAGFPAEGQIAFEEIETNGRDKNE